MIKLKIPKTPRRVLLSKTNPLTRAALAQAANEALKELRNERGSSRPNC